MFVLSKDEEKFVLLPCKSVYTVGRLSTDLIIQEDLSVSRTHVKLYLSGKDDETLQVEDLDSRYGTFIYQRNGKDAKKIATRTRTPLTAGICLRFGGNTSVWQVSQLKLVTTASALTRPQVQELEELLKPLGAVVSLNWTEECSHLTMNEASVTVKLLHALLENKPIVTFAFWRKLLQVAQRTHVKEGWPQPKDYQPTNMDVKWRPERTTLFAGKTFVFMNRKHLEIYGAVVQKAGAACKDLKSGVRKNFLTKKDVIVIQYVPSTQSQATESLNSIQEILEQAGLRVIQEYEIGMALLHCSIKEFCNPAHKFINDSLPTTESVTSSMDFNSSILAPNTERNVGRSCAEIISELTVPESEVPQQPVTSKRTAQKRHFDAVILESSDEEQEKAASKRAKPMLQEKPMRIEKNNAIEVNSSDEDEPPAPVPQKKHLKQKVTPVFCIDSSDEENNNDAEKPKESSAREVNIPETRNKADSELIDNAQLATKKPMPSAVTRTSPRLKANTEAKNITNKQAEKPIGQTKRPVLPVAFDPEDDNDAAELFQFSKTPQKPLERKSAAKANNPPGRINVINFLQKSQPQESSPKSQLPSQSQTESRKRPRLELLNESDSDDGEDLFNFADSNKKKQKKTELTNDDSNDGFFNFNNSEERQSGLVNQDFVQTEPFCPETELEKAKSKYIVPQRKEQPRKVDVSGWLSCIRLHDSDIKSEANVSVEMASLAGAKLEKSLKEDPDSEEEDSKKHLKWMAAMNDGIQVRMCNLNITTTRKTDAVDAASLNGSASNNYGGRKNFKKFVKTTNPHPQRRVVSLKRLQLVDGMVTCT
ncbi:nibrin [Drosophila serrata]|uniref:nibrin n=1 Tax=Drosophila serrata TaxID=7274 RepID=UPI000A1D0F8C|nr:nibrin [Drosophila serrata]